MHELRRLLSSSAIHFTCAPKSDENTSLRNARQVPVAAAGLAPCLGDVAVVRVVTKECGDRAATVLEQHLRHKNVAKWAGAGGEAWAGGGGGEGGRVGGGESGGGEGGGGAGGAGYSAKALGQADELLEELALLTQYTESYDRFVRFLVEEVRVFFCAVLVLYFVCGA